MMISRFINPVTITVGLTTIGTLIGIGIENWEKYFGKE